MLLQSEAATQLARKIHAEAVATLARSEPAKPPQRVRPAIPTVPKPPWIAPVSISYTRREGETRYALERIRVGFSRILREPDVKPALLARRLRNALRKRDQRRGTKHIVRMVVDGVKVTRLQ